MNKTPNQLLLNQEQLEIKAKHLAESITAPCFIALWGDIGSGKSTFARAFIQSLLPDVKVPSPTFTIIQTYAAEKFNILHCDLYRLSGADEVEEIGLLEALGKDVCLVEWPERMENMLPKNRIDITIKTTGVELIRTFQQEFFCEN